MPNTHEATVVVALIPGGDSIDRILAALARQEERNFELIIVDCRPTAGPAETDRLLAAAAIKGLDAQHIAVPGTCRASGNNIDIRLAETELVLLLAYDFVPGEHFVAAHLALHRRDPDRRRVGVGPGLFPAPLRNTSFRRWLEDSGEAFGTSFTTGGPGSFPPRFFYCANVSAKRRFLLEAGLFDEHFCYDSWEAAELALRLAHAGLRSSLVAEAVTWHDHRVTLTERCGNMERAGASAAIFEGKYPGPHSWQASARRPPWRLSLAARWRRARALVTRSPRDREKAWRLELDRAFASGYRRARRTAVGPLRSS